MFSVGEKIVYGENGVCTVEKIAPMEGSSCEKGKLYYFLSPLIGSGIYYAPIDSAVFMRAVISKDEAEALIASIPSIEPAICTDNRFNHVYAFYRDLFKLHTNEALVSIIKGLSIRMSEKKTKSGRNEATLKRAKDILHGELSVALGMGLDEVEAYIVSKTGAVL